MNQVNMDPIASYLGAWTVSLNLSSILLRLALSFLFSSVIGCERSNKRHSAGLRTFILVSLGSTTAMMTDLYLIATAGEVFPALSTAAGIGIATISTYSILYSSKSQIKGLTTAAGLWTSSILGLAVGCGLYTLSAAGFIAVLCSLALLPSLEVYLKNRSNHFEVHLELKDKHDLHDFITTIRKLGLTIDDIELNPAYLNSGLSVFSISLTIIATELKKYKTHNEIIEALKTLGYISYIEEIH
jgi:putative Mg2+ transporter-C (MgtC) family protein